MDAPFLGFPETMAFLADLAAHNDRTWFAANKTRFERVYRQPAEAFVAELRPRLEALVGCPVVAKVFRIHRDVRFSKDKTPYNTHLHIGLQAHPLPGEPRRRGGFYFGLDTTKLSLGVGDFEFNAADLERYRRAVDNAFDGAALADLLTDLSGRLLPAELKRMPAPYAADHPRSNLLRRKGLSVWRDIAEPGRIASSDLVDDVVAAFEALDPVNVWLNEVLEAP